VNVDGTIAAGRYRLGDEVGRGRSVVYEARDTRLGRAVAVKRVDSGGPDGDDARARALREARAAARFSSSHVVGIYDVVEEDGAIWLVMELVRAPSLDRLVRTSGPLDEARAARVGLSVLAALEAAHAAGIVHRDVKPGNVLMAAGPDGDDAVKLADFGVASVNDDRGLTATGLVVGSPSYMAPEQAMGRPAGPAADLWALGALLYFAVEGEPPFAGDSPIATASAVVHGRPRPQARPGRLTRLIELLLVKQPEQRPTPDRIRAILAPVATAPAAPGGDEETTLTTLAPLPVGRTELVPGPAHRQAAGGRRHRARWLVGSGIAAAALAGGVLLWPAGSEPPAPGRVQPADAQTAETTTTAPPTTVAPAGRGHQNQPAAEVPAADPGAGVVTPGPQVGAGPTATAPTTTPVTTPTTEPPTTEPPAPDPTVPDDPGTTVPESPPTTVAETVG
jgi:hypothetical protein